MCIDKNQVLQVLPGDTVNFRAVLKFFAIT